MLEPQIKQHVHRVTYNTARNITSKVRPATNPILSPDDWFTAGNSDQRPNVAMHANTAPCVAVNNIIYKSDRSRQKVRVRKRCVKNVGTIDELELQNIPSICQILHRQAWLSSSLETWNA